MNVKCFAPPTDRIAAELRAVEESEKDSPMCATKQGGFVSERKTKEERGGDGSKRGRGETRWYRELDVRARDDEERTALHGAASDGLQEAVAILLERGADVDARDQYGATPLHLAAKNGCREVADLLVQSGASVSKKDNSGQTPLDCARVNRHWRLARQLTRAEECQVAERSRGN
jgi:hypothetical protein